MEGGRMTITAREALQALLEGKTLLTSDDNLYEIHNERLVISYNGGLNWHTDSDLNEIEEVFEEFYLTFAQALRSMLEGRVVMSESSVAEIRLQYRFNYECSCFEYRMGDEGDWRVTHIRDSEQKSMWKVVE